MACGRPRGALVKAQPLLLYLRKQRAQMVYHEDIHTYIHVEGRRLSFTTRLSAQKHAIHADTYSAVARTSTCSKLRTGSLTPTISWCRPHAVCMCRCSDVFEG